MLKRRKFFVYGEKMKGWNLTKPFNLIEQEITENETVEASSKVRIVKALLTLADVLRYNGNVDTENVVLGSSGIGIVSETDTNLFDLKKGKHIYIESNQECNECYNCKSGKFSKCIKPLTAGEDYNGFLTDFISVATNKSFVLPDNVTDVEALFIDQISLALSVIDKLEIQKGDYVTIVGANNLGVILAQLLIYYQSVPIIVSNDEEDCQIARDSGIYYVLGPDDNWQKEIAVITSHRMCSKVVYISDCGVQIAKGFALASHGASIAYTGVSNKANSFSFVPAVKKQLTILCINNGFGNTEASINLLANKVINFSNLKINTVKYQDVPSELEAMNALFEETGKVRDTIVEMI